MIDLQGAGLATRSLSLREAGARIEIRCEISEPAAQGAEGRSSRPRPSICAIASLRIGSAAAPDCCRPGAGQSLSACATGASTSRFSV